MTTKKFPPHLVDVPSDEPPGRLDNEPSAPDVSAVAGCTHAPAHYTREACVAYRAGRLCPGCRSLDGEHTFGATCTLRDEAES